MLKNFHTIFLSIVLLILTNCRNEPPQIQVEKPQPITTIYLIRHAEKDRTDPQNPDPELNQKGLGRAMHWAEIFDDIALDLVYSTDYERTSMTAAPVSVKKDIPVEYYDPKNIDIQDFKLKNLGKRILVVGHSNTIPEMVNGLIGEEEYAQMDDTDNGSLFIVNLIGSQSFSSRLRINCNCPD